MTPTRSAPWCILIASFCVLMLQITVIRILSVVLWYHWAFLSISLAMLGVGVPGVWFALRRPRPELVAPLLSVAGVLIPASVVAIVRLSSRFGEHRALWCVACLLPPMLVLGAVVCLLLLEARARRVALLYGFDLLGACLGAVLVIPAMHLVSTPRLAAGLGFAALLAAWLRRARPSNLDLGVAGALVALLWWGKPLEVRHNKAYDESEQRLLHEVWTPTARLTFFGGVIWRPDPRQGFAWGPGSRQPRVQIEQYWMEQDGSAGTPVTRFDGDLSKLEYLLYDVTTVGYQLAAPDRVVIIGGGGGRDILTAKVAGASRIEVVEINGAIVDTLSTRFGDFSGDVYHLDGVVPVIREGRSHLRRSEGGYDLIQISLIDSWAATAAGAFALSENNLYTLEAYRLYLGRLSDDGMISTSRWTHAGMGFEILRLWALAKSALLAAGVEDPGAHLALVEAAGVGTVLMAKRPFTGEQIDRLAQLAADRGFSVVHPPLGPGHAEPASPPQVSIFQQILEDESAFTRRIPLDLSPPTDDRPFFFHALGVFEPIDERLAATLGFNASAVRVLQQLMLVLAAVTLLLFFAPFGLRRWRRRREGLWQGSAYFACIGVGFMLIEVPWLQRFILFLEHPSHATTVVLACLLLGAGLGSLVSSRIEVGRWQRWAVVLPIVLALLNLALPRLFEAALGWPFAWRVALSVAILVPVGIPMGCFFPMGMRRFGDANKAWFWAVNGAFGVLASVASLALAMQLGFRAVTWIGVGSYLASWLALRGRPLGESVTS